MLLRKLVFCGAAAAVMALAVTSPASAQRDSYNRGSPFEKGDRRVGLGSDGGSLGGLRLPQKWNGVDFYGNCKEVTNGAIAEVFLPSRFEDEYNRFLNGGVPGIGIADCRVQLTTTGACPTDCTAAPVTITQEKECINSIGTQLELAICDPTLTAGDASKVIDCTFNPFETTSVCQGTDYIQTTTCRGEVRNVDTIVNADQCKKPPFTAEWEFTQNYGSQTSYNKSIASSGVTSERMWRSSPDGYSVGAYFQDSANCSGLGAQSPMNAAIQRGTATARFKPNVAMNMRIVWRGWAETQNGILDGGGEAATFENMSMFLNGGTYANRMIGKAVSMGGAPNGSCGMTNIAVLVGSTDQTYRIEPDIEYTLNISTDTIDPLFHVGAYYSFELQFVPISTN